MSRLLQDGLTAPLRYKLLGLTVALVLGFGISVTAFMMRLLSDIGLIAASVFGIVMGVVGLMVAGFLVRRKRAG